MLLYSYYDSDTGIKTTESIEYSDEEIEKSKKKFEELKDKKIISGNFEDIEWHVTNEVIKRTINFEFDEILYNKESKKRNMYTYKQFINSIKSYVVLTIESKSLISLAPIVSSFKKYILATNYFNKKKLKEGIESLGTIQYQTQDIRYIEGYVQYANFEGTEYYSSALEDLLEYALTIKNSQV